MLECPIATAADSQSVYNWLMPLLHNTHWSMVFTEKVGGFEPGPLPCQSGVLPCSDGWVEFILTEKYWVDSQSTDNVKKLKKHIFIYYWLSSR